MKEKKEVEPIKININKQQALKLLLALAAYDIKNLPEIAILEMLNNHWSTKKQNRIYKTTNILI